MVKSRSRGSSGSDWLSESPMSLIQANHVWSREAIRKFTFDQPPRSESKTIKGRKVDRPKRVVT